MPLRTDVDLGIAVAGFAGAGFALVAAGSAAIVTHLSHAPGFASTICGATGPLAFAHGMGSAMPHCWGCPAVLVGSALSLGALAAASLLPNGGPSLKAEPGAIARA